MENLKYVLILFALFTLPAQAFSASDEATAQYQKIFVKQQNKGIEQLLDIFEKEEGIFKADSSFSATNYLSPEGKHLLVTYSQVMPDNLDKWTFIVMNFKTLRIERLFDFLRATGIEKVQWLDEKQFIVLSQNTNLCGPPGELFVVNALSGNAIKLDSLVWKYFIDEENQDHIFYEKSEDPKIPYGKRHLIDCNLLNIQKRKIHSVEHPVTQFGKVGPMESGGSFLSFGINTYGETFEPDVCEWWFDMMTGKSFKQKKKVVEPKKVVESK
jgi:hypothetical protein